MDNKNESHTATVISSSKSVIKNRNDQSGYIFHLYYLPGRLPTAKKGKKSTQQGSISLGKIKDKGITGARQCGPATAWFEAL